MKNVRTYTQPLFVAALLIVFVSASAWQTGSKSKVQSKTNTGDTVKPGGSATAENELRVKDLDQAMKELDEAMKTLNNEMKNIDFSKMEKEIKVAMKGIDMKKIGEEVKNSMAKVDWSKIQLEVNQAMEEAEIKMKEIDFSKMEKEKENMQKNLEKQQLNLNLNGEKIRVEVEKGMQHAKEGMEKAKVEIQNLKDFTTALENDGLIDKKKGYRIQVKDGELYLNGIKQSKETTEKYKKYFRKENLTISNDGDDIITI